MKKTFLHFIIVAALAATNFSPKTVFAEEYFVEITGFVFVPDKLKVSVGDTVTWINLDIVPHTATAVDESWDTGAMQQNESKSISVTEDFISDYFCAFHPTMKGKLELL